MTNGGYLSQTTRNGARMGDTQLIDMMVGALTDPFAAVHMGVSAENVAEKWQLTRAMQDEFAVESHRRAAAAIAAGRLKEQIVPIELKSHKGTRIFDTDEHVRADASIEGMGKLRTVFEKAGSVTADNVSGINDGVAAVVLAEAGYAENRGLSPMARLRSYAFAGVDPAYMGEGPIPAVNKA
jgi:acetyl-CoA C-acetyltransferase